MHDLFLFALAAVGMTHIVVDSKIAAPVREWFAGSDHWLARKVAEGLNCYQCSGLWCGIAAGVLTLLGHYCPAPLVLLYGFAGSFLAVLGAVLVSYLNVAAVPAEGN